MWLQAWKSVMPHENHETVDLFCLFWSKVRVQKQNEYLMGRRLIRQNSARNGPMVAFNGKPVVVGDAVALYPGFAISL